MRPARAPGYRPPLASFKRPSRLAPRLAKRPFPPHTVFILCSIDNNCVLVYIDLNIILIYEC
ncbi:UNVERIFIED_ORG: hypothetical protein QOE_3983 [Clostridioides difficile F501]